MSNTKAHRGSASGTSRSDSDALRHTEACTQVYLRNRDLPRLIPLWPSELEIINRSDHLRLLARLRRALRAERQRGLAGHWAYDLARHAQLLRAYRAETTAYLTEKSMLVDQQTDRG